MESVNWPTIGSLVVLLTLSNGGMIFAWKVLVERLTTELKAMRDEFLQGKERTLELEKEILRLRADLPRDYVRREDWIRFGGTIDAKLEGLAKLIMERRNG